MKRREFIQAALAGLALTSLPLSAVAENSEWNTEKLIKAIENMFDCVEGPPEKFFAMDEKTKKISALKKITVQDKRRPNITHEVYAEPGPGQKHYLYDTYACYIQGGDAKDAEAKLAEHFYKHISQLPVGLLVWRIKPYFHSSEVTEYGQTFMTYEAYEDSFNKIVLPPDVELDELNNAYRKVVRKTIVHKLRMRMSIPHLYEDDTVLAAIYKAEGQRMQGVA